jgi:archaellum biogenesis protein FlaJ (TadC family)
MLLSLFIFISLLIVPLISYGVPKGYVLAFEIAAYALVIILMPFIYKLSNKDEQMWQSCISKRSELSLRQLFINATIGAG